MKTMQTPRFAAPLVTLLLASSLTACSDKAESPGLSPDATGSVVSPANTATTSQSSSQPPSTSQPNGATTTGSVVPSNGSSATTTPQPADPSQTTTTTSEPAMTSTPVAPTEPGSANSSAPEGTASESGADTAPAGSETSSGGAPDSFDRTTAAGTCGRWNADRVELSEGTWSGNVETCDPGDISAEGRANALRLYNLYRWLADLPAVETTDELNQMAQACALLQEANDSLSHDPPMTWKCWTQLGADGAGSSNISTGSGVASADGYMLDPGNETTLGHRRWILSNTLGPIGLGSTGNGASCMQNLDGKGNVGKPWQAYPPPGIFPLQAFAAAKYNRTTVDEVGWSIQSDDIDLARAEVTVTSNGETLPVATTVLEQWYGSKFAIRFTPEDWQSAPGTYHVAVAGIATPIEYDVEVVDCAE